MYEAIGSVVHTEILPRKYNKFKILALTNTVGGSRGLQIHGYGHLTCCWRDPVSEDLGDTLFPLELAQKYYCSATFCIATISNQ